MSKPYILTPIPIDHGNCADFTGPQDVQGQPPGAALSYCVSADTVKAACWLSLWTLTQALVAAPETAETATKEQSPSCRARLSFMQGSVTETLILGAGRDGHILIFWCHPASDSFRQTGYGKVTEAATIR